MGKGLAPLRDRIMPLMLIMSGTVTMMGQRYWLRVLTASQPSSSQPSNALIAWPWNIQDLALAHVAGDETRRRSSCLHLMNACVPPMVFASLLASQWGGKNSMMSFKSKDLTVSQYYRA